MSYDKIACIFKNQNKQISKRSKLKFRALLFYDI